jgi:hypothetical protein
MWDLFRLTPLEETHRKAASSSWPGRSGPMPALTHSQCTTIHSGWLSPVFDPLIVRIGFALPFAPAA